MQKIYPISSDVFLNHFEEFFEKYKDYNYSLEEKVINTFYDAAETIDEEYPDLREKEQNDDERWYDAYFDEVCEKYMEMARTLI